MMTDAEKDTIAEEIDKLFEGLSLDDVAGILTVQLAMLVVQGADNMEGAMEFLDDIRDNAEEIVKTVSFEANGEDATNDNLPADTVLK